MRIRLRLKATSPLFQEAELEIDAASSLQIHWASDFSKLTYYKGSKPKIPVRWFEARSSRLHEIVEAVFKTKKITVLSK